MKRTFSLLLSAVIGAVFVYAGVLKALEPARFSGDIGNYRLLPWHATVLVALYLPWLEITCGVALIFRKCYPGVLFILALLCIIFLAALSSAKMRGLDISCGCFGHAVSYSLATSVMIDLGIFAALLLLLWEEMKQRKKPIQES